MAKSYDDIGGVWRTIGGRRVFIKDGQSLDDAMRESGKFKSHKKIKIGDERDKKLNEVLDKNKNKTQGELRRAISESEDEIEKIGLKNLYDNMTKEDENIAKAMPEGAKFNKMLEENKVRSFKDNIELQEMSRMSYKEMDTYDRTHSYNTSDNAEFARAKTLYYETGLEKYKKKMDEILKKHNIR